MRVDLNADAGESFGLWKMGRDEDLFEHLTSVNLACGFHAGDPLTIQRTVALAKRHGVQVGAHPGFADREGFGRRNIDATPEEIYADTLYQLGALTPFLRREGLELHHVKPHGALYLKAMREAAAADAVARAVSHFDSSLPLVVLGGPGGAVMLEAARGYSLTVVLEAFPDRAYLPSGHLAPRGLEGAVIHDPAVAARRAVAMVTEGRVEALGGGPVEVHSQTLCVHGDNPGAPELARAVRQALEAAGVGLEAF